MANKTYHIAKFYSKLFELKDFLNAELLPISVHIKAETTDPKLFEILEALATDIKEHLDSYELTINKQGEPK